MSDFSCDLVSIVVPVFNSAKTLEECLESARVQTYSNIEVIVVDDGSSDGSFAVASSFASSDSRFVVFHQDNMGVGAARNNALSHCSGSWVFFLDADDLLTPTAIEDLLSATDLKTDLVVGSFQKFRTILNARLNNKSVYREKCTYFADGKSVPLSVIDEALSLVSSKLFRRSVIVKANLVFGSVPYSEDHRFGLAFVAAGDGTVKSIDKIVYHYRCGGVATTMRFYPDMDRISLSMLTYYREICVGSQRFLMDMAFCNDAPSRWLDGVLMHFSVCAPHRQVKEKCLAAITEFSVMGEPYRFSAVPSDYYTDWEKSHRIKIILKRLLRALRLNGAGR